MVEAVLCLPKPFFFRHKNSRFLFLFSCRNFFERGRVLIVMSLFSFGGWRFEINIRWSEEKGMGRNSLF